MAFFAWSYVYPSWNNTGVWRTVKRTDTWWQHIPHHRCVGDTTLAARPRTRAVQDRGANIQSSARQRATISGSGTSCRRRGPTWSACSAVSKYQPPGHTAHQTVYCWQLCLSGCCSSSLEQPARGRVVSTSDSLTACLASLKWSL